MSLISKLMRLFNGLLIFINNKKSYQENIAYALVAKTCDSYDFYKSGPENKITRSVKERKKGLNPAE